MRCVERQKQAEDKQTAQTGNPIRARAARAKSLTQPDDRGCEQYQAESCLAALVPPLPLLRLPQCFARVSEGLAHPPFVPQRQLLPTA